MYISFVHFKLIPTEDFFYGKLRNNKLLGLFSYCQTWIWTNTLPYFLIEWIQATYQIKHIGTNLCNIGCHNHSRTQYDHKMCMTIIDKVYIKTCFKILEWVWIFMCDHINWNIPGLHAPQMVDLALDSWGRSIILQTHIVRPKNDSHIF